MADGVFFADKTKDLLVKLADDATKAGIFEPFDGPAYRIVLNQIDKYADKVVPDEYDVRINKSAQLALNGEYEESAKLAGFLIDELIDIQSIPDELERLVFVDGLIFLVRQLQLFIEKKKSS